MSIFKRRAWQCLCFSISLGASGVAWGSNCEVVQAIPPGSNIVGTEELKNPASSVLGLRKRVATSGNDIVVLVERQSEASLISLLPTFKGNFAPICSTLNVPQGKSIYRVGSFDGIVNVDLSGGPGANAKFTVYTAGQAVGVPSQPTVPQRVRVPVEAFVFSNALLTDIDGHFAAASEIWAKAGVVLVFKIRRFDAAKTKEILGEGMAILTYLGCSQRFEEMGFKQRDALSKLKSKPLSMAVFVAPNKTQSQAEPEFVQAYISNDPFASPKGRTVAHEVGHLLLGEGHPGGTRGIGPCTPDRASDPAPMKEQVKTTSGLMGASDTTSSTTVDPNDAALARQKAISLPGATWW